MFSVRAAGPHANRGLAAARRLFYYAPSPEDPPMRAPFAALALFALTAPLAAGEADEFIKEAREALKAGDADAALAAGRKAVEADPRSAAAFLVRGDAQAARRQPAEAIKDYDTSLELDKTLLIAADRRGGEKFKLGLIPES